MHPTGLVDPREPDAKVRVSRLCHCERGAAGKTAVVAIVGWSPQVKFLAAEALRGSGGIVLDNYGQRFCDDVCGARTPRCVLGS